jgi:hypothetical protein
MDHHALFEFLHEVVGTLLTIDRSHDERVEVSCVLPLN